MIRTALYLLPFPLKIRIFSITDLALSLNKNDDFASFIPFYIFSTMVNTNSLYKIAAKNRIRLYINYWFLYPNY